jgi:hypothetical protein
MKRLLAGVVVLLLTGLAASCGDANPTGNSGPSISGTVTDVVSGAALANVNLGAQGKTATTGADGKYTLSGLTNGAATLTAQRQGHVNFTQNVTVSGSTTVNVPMTPSSVARVAGNWTGTWRNTTFNTSGPVTLGVTVNTVAETFQMVLDIGGGVFGAGDPPSETFTGSYSEATGASLTRTSTLLGTVTATVTPAGVLTGTCTNIPNAGINRIDFTGTVTASTIAINYTVTFTGGGTAVGTMTLTK